MSQMLQTRSSKSHFILYLLLSLQIALSGSHPVSTTNDGTPPCDSSNQSAECATSVSQSPAPRSCKAHQREFDQTSMKEYQARCDYDEANRKNAAKTLEQADLVDCYRPQCNSSNRKKYTTKQCSFLFSEWCWCSTPQGQAINGTFQKNMPAGFCTIQQHCHVDGQDYDIGSIFTPHSVCGLCECHSDGTHTCFVDYTVDANNQLSNEQLESLKNDLIQVFKLQQRKQPVDIQQIRKMNSELQVLDDEKSEVLSSKFTVYDRDGDGALNHFEKFKFHTELGTLFGCNRFFDHLNKLMDGNKDHEISLQEWKVFFGILTAVSEVDVSGDSPTQSVLEKREVPLDIRKPLHLRKKSQYVIS